MFKDLLLLVGTVFNVNIDDSNGVITFGKNIRNKSHDYLVSAVVVLL